MPDYQESIFRIDHRAKTAHLWTERPSVKARAIRCGFTVERQEGRGVWMVGPMKAVSIRRPASGPRVFPKGRPFGAKA
jgi:hypothetical protein